MVQSVQSVIIIFMIIYSSALYIFILMKGVDVRALDDYINIPGIKNVFFCIGITSVIKFAWLDLLP